MPKPIIEYHIKRRNDSVNSETFKFVYVGSRIKSRKLDNDRIKRIGDKYGVNE